MIGMIPGPVIFYARYKPLLSYRLAMIFTICDAGYAVNIDAF